jgi:hypothetical protein
MDFVNKSKSLVQKTKENMAIFWEECVAIWKQSGIPIPEKPQLGKVEENWDKYLHFISGYDACPICNGLVVGKRCKRFPSHTMALKIHNDRGLSFDTLLGPLCQHGYYLVECEECIQVACAENIERNSDAAENTA